jgi:hypothetical protein
MAGLNLSIRERSTKKAFRVLSIYLVALFAFSILFSNIGLKDFELKIINHTWKFSPNLVIVVLGGLVSLYLTIEKKQFKVFVLIYVFLWILKFSLLIIGKYAGVVKFFGKPIDANLYIKLYYETVSRIATPIPFILFWFICYLFSANSNSLIRAKTSPNQKTEIDT